MTSDFHRNDVNSTSKKDVEMTSKKDDEMTSKKDDEMTSKLRFIFDVEITSKSREMLTFIAKMTSK